MKRSIGNWNYNMNHKEPYDMKRIYWIPLIMLAALSMGCSRHGLVNEPSQEEVAPIEFSVQKENITRVANLEAVNHYNFGVWAWKVNGTNSLPDREVIRHYLVGWSDGTGKGYDKTGATTYHISPWFYEGLGNEDYTYSGEAGYYKATDADYMSAQAKQYLRYWDLAYENTNFFCYAPYNKNVSFSFNADNHTGTMSFGAANTIRDGYDEPQNSSYAHYDRSLGEYMYAGIQTLNSALARVNVPFKHMGAQLLIRFYEDVPGYKVELIDLCEDHGATEATGDLTKGIQATPSIQQIAGADTTYANGTYYITSSATVSFAANATPTYTPAWEGSTSRTNTTPLMFKVPTAGLSTEALAPANLTDYAGLNDTVHKVIRDKSLTGVQEYSYSPTIYYPVAQPASSKTGLTFHVSYRLIAEDNQEVITVHNATVHVPYTGTVMTGATEASALETSALITAWQPNMKYTYTFKITTDTSGTTSPTQTIDPTSPTPGKSKALYPIVFEQATIVDYTENLSEYVVSTY